MSTEFNLVASLKALFCSLIHSIFKYGSVLWDPPTATAHMIERVQRKFFHHVAFKLHMPASPWLLLYPRPFIHSRPSGSATLHTFFSWLTFSRLNLITLNFYPVSPLIFPAIVHDHLSPCISNSPQNITTYALQSSVLCVELMLNPIFSL